MIGKIGLLCRVFSDTGIKIRFSEHLQKTRVLKTLYLHYLSMNFPDFLNSYLLSIFLPKYQL